MDTIARWLLGKKVVKKAKVMHEYKAANPDELTIEVGQIIEILKQVRYASSAVISVSYTHLTLPTNREV